MFLVLFVSFLFKDSIAFTIPNGLLINLDLNFPNPIEYFLIKFLINFDL